MKVLVVDVGGTRVKILATGRHLARAFRSGPALTPKQMVTGVQALAKDWTYDVVSIGYPGPVRQGRPLIEPHNLGTGWVGFDFQTAFRRPVKIINDAAMQALGSYEGGKSLFLGLGTGLGSTFILDGIVAPLELAHLPYKKGTFEDYVGLRGLEKYGTKKWGRFVADVVARLTAALDPDEVVLGGGNAKKLKELPPGSRMVDNTCAFRGGFRLWNDSEKRKRKEQSSGSANRTARRPRRRQRSGMERSGSPLSEGSGSSSTPALRRRSRTR